MAKKKIFFWGIIAVVLFFIAVAWNIQTGGNYNLEIAIGALVLGIIISGRNL